MGRFSRGRLVIIDLMIHRGMFHEALHEIRKLSKDDAVPGDVREELIRLERLCLLRMALGAPTEI